MKFNENLVNLRKQNNMSQDTLAEKINVSRQTIYKWETGATYPDMDKIMDIAKIFNINIDTLINGDINEERYTSDEILSRIKSNARCIAISVLAILVGVATVVFMAAFDQEGQDTLSIYGVIIMMAIIFVSVLVIIFSSIKLDHFKKENNLVFEATKKEKEKAQNNFITFLISGLAAIFLGILLVIGSAILESEQIEMFATSVMLVLIGIGACLIIYGAMVNELYQDKERVLLDKETASDHISGIIFLAAVAIFLLLGFLLPDPFGWKYGWIVFPVAGIACGIIYHIRKLKGKETE